MDELMLIEYMKNKGMDNLNEEEFMAKFKEMSERNSHRFDTMTEPYNEPYNYKNNYDRDMYRVYDQMKNSLPEQEHFNGPYAKYIVSNMCHYEGNKKYTGEKYNMEKAKDVFNRYRGMIPTNVTHTDIYVALNSQYHSYAYLFKMWFGDNIDQKIIDSAILFWFKDPSYKKGFKLCNYYK